MARVKKPTLGTITIEVYSPINPITARRAVLPGAIEVLANDAKAMLDDLNAPGVVPGPVGVIWTKYGLCLETCLTCDRQALEPLKRAGWKIK